VAQPGLVGLVERRGPVAALAEACFGSWSAFCGFLVVNVTVGWRVGRLCKSDATTSSIGRSAFVKDHLLERYIE
jgi:hypothetical protein